MKAGVPGEMLTRYSALLDLSIRNNIFFCIFISKIMIMIFSNLKMSVF